MKQGILFTIITIWAMAIAHAKKDACVERFFLSARRELCYSYIIVAQGGQRVTNRFYRLESL